MLNDPVADMLTRVAFGFVSALVGTTGYYALLGRRPARVR